MSTCREDLMGIGYRMWTSADEREGGRSAYKYEHENAGVDAELSHKANALVDSLSHGFGLQRLA
jgi:hypothetical protein